MLFARAESLTLDLRRAVSRLTRCAALPIIASLTIPESENCTDPPDVDDAGRVGRKIALWLVLPALGLFLFSFPAAGIGEAISRKQPLPSGWSIVSGFALFAVGAVVVLTVLYFPVAFLGRAAGKIIHRRMRGVAGAAFVGACFGVLCWASFAVVFGLCAGITLMTTDAPAGDAFLMIGVQAVLITFLGSLPAVAVGALYGSFVRLQLQRRVLITSSREAHDHVCS